ncbi:MAG: EAL domain-containing protein [Frankiaceae bacterium]|nr:EAL domain-containing protein [Frankiaceae bacterium]
MNQSWFEEIVAVAREAGACADAAAAFEQITEAAVYLLDFEAAAIEVADADGGLRVAAVAGPPQARAQLGQRISPGRARRLIDLAEQWGQTCFLAHDADQALTGQASAWAPDQPAEIAAGTPGQQSEAAEARQSETAGARQIELAVAQIPAARSPAAEQSPAAPAAPANPPPPRDTLVAPIWGPDGSLLGALRVEQPATGRKPDAERRAGVELLAVQAAAAMLAAAARQEAEQERERSAADRLAAEQRWRLTFEHSPVGTALLSPDGLTIRRVNAALAHLLRCRPEDMTGHQTAEFTEPSEYADYLGDALFAEVLAGYRDAFHITRRYTRADGSIMWGDSTVGLVRDRSGEPTDLLIQVADVSDTYRAREWQREAEEQWRLTFEHSPVGAQLIAADAQTISQVNAALPQMLRCRAQDLVGHQTAEFIHPDEYGTESDFQAHAELMAGVRETAETEKRLIRGDGTIMWARLTEGVIRDSHGELVNIIGQVTDITDLRMAEEQRRIGEEQWRLAFEHSPLGTSLLTPDGMTILQVNAALAQLLWHRQEEMIGQPSSAFTYPDEFGDELNIVRFAELMSGERNVFQKDMRLVRADGTVIWTDAIVGLVRGGDGEVLYVVSQHFDITAQKLAEGRLRHQALHDPVTDLPNRAFIEEQLSGHLAAGSPCGVLFCNLDRFGAINDSLGRDIGDEVLAATGRRLQAIAPRGASVGRIGGDEFVVLVPHEVDPAALRAVGERLVRTLARPQQIARRTVALTASAGAAVTDPSQDTPGQVLRQANQALRRAKRTGRGIVEMYDPDRDRLGTALDLELEQSLRAALAEGGQGLLPYFQPIIDIATGRPVGCEALVSWRHPRRGLLQPADFLPLAEQSGLVMPLGWWMLSESCRAAPLLPPGFADSPWVAVNVSGTQLSRGQLGGAVSAALEGAGLPPQRLHLEITETALVEASPEAVRELREVAELGVCIALDDFGTGYSSLSLLRDLPVGAVKIDRSFVGPILSDPTAMPIVRSVIWLCQELGLTTVAEGVETPAQLEALRDLGCTQAQGFLIGHPAPIDELRAASEQSELWRP